MKKILMRAAMNPLDNWDSAKVIAKNMIGGNAGNMLFSYSVARALMCEDIVIDTTLTDRRFTDAEVDRINQEYECFVLPLANAFRITFDKEMVCLIELIRRLTIPCIVIGVGVQAKVDETMKQDFVFDDLSKQFIKEILGKSSMIGVRGEITADYMKKLGFIEEKDFTVIGCPSMYMHGDHLELKEPRDLTPHSAVSVNRKINISKKLHRFIVRSSKLFENYMYVPQGIDDLKLLYTGTPIDRNKYPNIPKMYPDTIEHKIYASGHEIGFTNVNAWLEFLRERDFSFGTRIHGNMAAVLAGIPVYIFAPDARILELARYHNIQHMLAKDIQKSTNIFDVYHQADFSSVKNGHKERFHHYLDFLEANGLQHVYGAKRTNLETPFDRAIATKQFAKGVIPITSLLYKEKMSRTIKYQYYNKVRQFENVIYNIKNKEGVKE